MTAPIILQQQGAGEAIQRGLTPILQALQFNRVRAQQQQQIQIQQQQLQLNQLNQRQTAKNQASQRMFRLMEMFGPEVLEDPSVAQQVTEAGLNPATLNKRFQDTRKAEEEQQQAAMDALVNSVPTPLQGGVRTFFNFLASGGNPEGATTLMREVFDRAATDISEEDQAALATEFPELFGPNARISTQEAMEQLVGIRVGQAEIRMRHGPRALNQVNVEIAELRRDALIRDAARDVTGDVSQSERLRAALALNSIGQDVLSIQNAAGFLLVWPDWLTLTPDQKLQRVFRSNEIVRAFNRVPRILTEGIGGVPPAGTGTVLRNQ